MKNIDRKNSNPRNSKKVGRRERTHTSRFLAIMSAAITMNKGSNSGKIIVIIPETIKDVGASRLPRFRSGFSMKIFFQIPFKRPAIPTVLRK